MAIALENWNAVKQLFEAALTQDAAQRSSFLKEQCADNGVRAEVERLLAEHDQAGSFLSTPIMKDLPLKKPSPQFRRISDGKVLGERYRVVGLLGSGGMGVVYKAFDVRSNNTVALKMLNGMGQLDRLARINLVREARTTAELRHRNIVQVLDIGQHKGLLYIVMEYLDGISLELGIKRRPAASLGIRLLTILQLCDGLGYAHRLGIIHRDIKPANVFISKNGPIKIVDFGIAKLVEEAGQSVTKDAKSAIAGTFAYMSPEQLNGRPVDRRTDIWSAGVTLYELLTYVRPFNGATLAGLAKSIENDPVPPLDSSHPHATELNRILQRALAKDRDQRYSNIGEFAQDLLNLAASGGLLEIRKAPSTETPRQGKRSKGRFSQLDLGFGFQSNGRPRFSEKTFTDRTHPVAELCLLGLLFVATPLTLVAVLGRLCGTIDSITALGLLMFFNVPPMAVLASLYCVRRTRAALVRKCRTCRWMLMRPVSKWSRYVTSNAEINWGFSDCIAALREGYYEDAAKLLTVHGAQNAVIYSVIRFNLEFFECNKCGDQRAALMVEEKFGSKWVPRERYQESYKHADGKAVPVVSASREYANIFCPNCQWQPRKEDAWSCTCGYRWNTFETKGVCPACSYRWQETACPSCGVTSAHSDWYTPAAVERKRK
jgi:serine/threonine protein kinase